MPQEEYKRGYDVLPRQAFEYYLSLGDSRSYESVAAHFGTTKPTVLRRARAESWQQRIAELKARMEKDRIEREVLLLEEVRQRHLADAREIQTRGLEALRELKIKGVMTALRAIELGFKHERLALGEPTEQVQHDIETTIRREYDRWMLESPADVAAEEAAEAELLDDGSGRNGSSNEVESPGAATEESPLPPTEPLATPGPD